MDPVQEGSESSTSTCLPKEPYKDPDDGRQHFLLELEFVQCLANPTYIHCIHIVCISLNFYKIATFAVPWLIRQTRNWLIDNSFTSGNTRNNRLKHIIPRPLPETEAQPPAPPTSNAVTVPTPTPTVSQATPSVVTSAPVKAEPARINVGERRKRKL